MKLRILQISDGTDDDGAAAALALLDVGLDREQFSLEPITLGKPRRGEKHFAMRGRLDPATVWRLRAEILRGRPDVVHVWGRACLAGQLSAALAGKVPLVATPGWSAKPLWPITSLQKWLYRRTNVIVVPTVEMADELQRAGAPRQAIRQIEPAVAPAEIVPEARAELLAELNLPPSVHLAGTAGSLEAHKRIKDLIWAADLLKVFRGDIHFVVFGSGPHERRLWKYRDQVRIAEKVHFLGDHPSARRWLGACEVFWLASRYESLSQPLLVAMAAGVPAVASDIAANRHLVVPGETGFLVPVGDRAGLGRCAGKIIDDAALARRLGAAARERARACFAPGPWIAAHAALYREVAVK